MENHDIIGIFNIITEKLIKSAESEVYGIIDKILVIGPNILEEEPLNNIFFENKINGMIILANSFILFYFIYYVLSNLISLYNGNKIENIYKFILRILIVIIIVNNSYYICSEVLNIFDILTEIIENIGSELTGKEILFVNFKEIISDIKDLQNNDILSLNGIIKGIISFGAVSILINLSIRYVTTIFLIFISPVAIMCLSNNITSGIFVSWGKMLISSLITQITIKVLMIIPMSYKNIDSLFYKIILVGTIYIIYKINSFVKELFSKITIIKRGE